MEREQTTVRLPVEVKHEIEKEANKRNISFNGMINMVIFEGLKVIQQKE